MQLPAFKRLFFAGLGLSIWHQGHKASKFNGVGNHALMLFAQAGAAGRRDLKLAGNKLPQDVGLLVVNVINFLLAGDAGHADAINNRQSTIFNNWRLMIGD